MKSTLMKLFIIGLCVSFFPVQAFAQGGFTGWFAIEDLYQRNCTDNQGLEIDLVADHNNPDGCSNAQTLELDCAEAFYLPSLALLLTAFDGNYEIQAFVNGCDSEGHAIVKAVNVRK